MEDYITFFFTLVFLIRVIVFQIVNFNLTNIKSQILLIAFLKLIFLTPYFLKILYFIFLCPCPHFLLLLSCFVQVVLCPVLMTHRVSIVEQAILGSQPSDVFTVRGKKKRLLNHQIRKLKGFFAVILFHFLFPLLIRIGNPVLQHYLATVPLFQVNSAFNGKRKMLRKSLQHICPSIEIEAALTNIGLPVTVSYRPSCKANRAFFVDRAILVQVIMLQLKYIFTDPNFTG